MAANKVLNMHGKEVGTIELPAEIFSAEINEDVVQETVRWQLARRRAGTQSALFRSEVSGGGRKPYKQKHTGRARAGSITSPLWIGGGVIHAPKPRCYDYKLPKKVRRNALISALSDKVKSGGLLVVNEFEVPTGKTSDAIKNLRGLGIKKGDGVLVIKGEGEMAEPSLRALRNIQKLTVLPVIGLNVYDLMRHRYLVGTKKGIAEIEKRLKAKDVAAD